MVRESVSGAYGARRAAIVRGSVPVTTAKSCLYVKRLADVDHAVLRQLIGEAFRSIDGRTLRSLEREALT